VPEEEGPASRAPAVSATLTTSTTGVVTWVVARYAFHGMIPPEVYGFVQLAVPAALGWAASCLMRCRQRRAAERRTEA
jgi:hypothetical protein